MNSHICDEEEISSIKSTNLQSRLTCHRKRLQLILSNRKKLQAKGGGGEEDIHKLILTNRNANLQWWSAKLKSIFKTLPLNLEAVEGLQVMWFDFQQDIVAKRVISNKHSGPYCIDNSKMHRVTAIQRWICKRHIPVELCNSQEAQIQAL